MANLNASNASKSARGHTKSVVAYDRPRMQQQTVVVVVFDAFMLQGGGAAAKQLQ